MSIADSRDISPVANSYTDFFCPGVIHTAGVDGYALYCDTNVKKRLYLATANHRPATNSMAWSRFATNCSSYKRA